VINPFRSERRWRGRRRIAVLVSIAGVLGVAALGSATSASAATVANCTAKFEPKSKNKPSANGKLSFVCDGPVRAYGVAGNKPIKDYRAPNLGAANAFFTCEGGGVGFGCGVENRATPGTQAPGTTGWNTTTPGASTSPTAVPTTCNGFRRVRGSQPPPLNGPNINAIVTGPCSQVIPAGFKVRQSIKLAQNPCAASSENPVRLFLFVGGEPGVTSLIAPVEGNSNPNNNGPGGDSTTVGEYIQGPLVVKMKAYKGCQSGGQGKGKSKGAKKSATPATKFPVSCSGSVAPATTPAGAQVRVGFTCNQNIRAFGIYSNKLIFEPGEEPEVDGPSGGQVNESALHQCEGDIPGYGYGCGIVDRQTVVAATATNPGTPNGNAISAGNTAHQRMAFEFSPCRRTGEPKTKVWILPMGEPTIGGLVGEFIGAPQKLALTGYGKCKSGKKKGGKK
jgi:hypothetical protein